MAVLVFVLGLVLLAAGLVCGYVSLDLLPTSPGLIYAFAGAVSVVGAIVVFALGLVIVRLGGLTKAMRDQAAAAAGLAAAAPALAQVTAEPPPLEGDESETPEPEGIAAEVETSTESEPEREIEPQPEPEDATEDLESEASAEAAEDETTETEAPLNENRAGRLPTLEEIERAIEKPEAPPTLIGRYSSGGANYMIFSDGTIEAETGGGAFKFASMGEFRKFLLDHDTGKA